MPNNMKIDYSEDKKIVKFLEDRLNRLLDQEYEEKERAKLYQTIFLERPSNCRNFELSTNDTDSLPYTNVINIEDDVNIKEESKCGSTKKSKYLKSPYNPIPIQTLLNEIRMSKILPDTKKNLMNGSPSLI